MTDKILDLTAVEADRRPVKIDDGPVCYMSSPDTLGPRDFAKVAAAGQRTVSSPEELDEDRADEMERAMTDAACLVLPDEPRNRVDALPFMRRARLVEAFISGLDKQPPASSPNGDSSTSEG